MNNGCGEKRIMHPSKIVNVEGYLGKYKSILKPGDAHYILLASSYRAPFYSSFAEKEAKYKPLGTGNIITRDRKKKELFQLMA